MCNIWARGDLWQPPRVAIGDAVQRLQPQIYHQCLLAGARGWTRALSLLVVHCVVPYKTFNKCSTLPNINQESDFKCFFFVSSQYEDGRKYMIVVGFAKRSHSGFYNKPHFKSSRNLNNFSVQGKTEKKQLSIDGYRH